MSKYNVELRNDKIYINNINIIKEREDAIDKVRYLLGKYKYELVKSKNKELQEFINELTDLLSIYNIDV